MNKVDGVGYGVEDDPGPAKYAGPLAHASCQALLFADQCRVVFKPGAQNLSLSPFEHIHIAVHGILLHHQFE
jgi:hypothetical protein